MKHEPYPYQKKLFNDVIESFDKGNRAVGVYLPTRGGKSIVALQLVEKFYDQGVWFIAHTGILINQMRQELIDNEIKHGVIKPGFPELRYNVQVISKDTLFNRIDNMIATGWKMPKLIIVDEAHLSMSPRYSEILEKLSGSLLVGLSATWCRLDKKAFNPPFTDLVLGPPIKKLQQLNRLCLIDTFIVQKFDDSDVKKSGGDYNKHDLEEKVDKPFILSEIVGHWEKIAKNKKTLVFCVGIEHAKNMATEFAESGYSARFLSSKNSSQEIDDTLKSFYSGEFKILVSVELFIMGFTVRDCECIIQARPTMSLMIYLQIMGRGMMTSPGKPHLINIDACNNFDRFGYPDADRKWSLLVPPKIEKGISKYKTCPDCMHPVLKKDADCPHCGYHWQAALPALRTGPEEAAGQLIRPDDKSDVNRLVLAIARGANKLEKAYSIGEQMGADRGLVEIVWRDYLKKA